MSDDMISRSISLGVFLPGSKNDEERQKRYKAIINSIRQYRATARYVYGILFNAHAAGAEFDTSNENFRVLPKNDRAKEIMALALNKRKEDGTLYRAPVYEVRDHIFGLNPTWISFVFDSMRAEVSAKWSAPDTEHPKASRGFMTLQGERGIARFAHIGIGFPKKTARPRLEGHSVFLKWDREIGEVEFRFEKLDSGQYYTWKQIRDSIWGLGTIFLKEDEGQIGLSISYSRLRTLCNLDPDRELRVSFSDEVDSFIRMSGPDGESSYDSVSASAAIAGIDELKKISQYYDKRKGACGNKRAPWGIRKAFVDSAKTLRRVTERREMQQKDWNHRWSKRIVENAKRWRCGKVTFVGCPKESLADRPWQWSQLSIFSKYKITEIGGLFSNELVEKSE